MRITPGNVVVVVAVVVLLAVFGADVVAGVGWSDGAALGAKVAAVAAALLVAGVCYQRWGSVTTEQRTPLVHAAAGASLVGGAALASAVTSAADDRVVGGSPLATVGVAALVAAAVCHVLAGRTR